MFAFLGKKLSDAQQAAKNTARKAACSASLFYNLARGWDRISQIMFCLFVGQIPSDFNSPQQIFDFVAETNPNRRLGLVVSVVEAHELKPDGFFGVTIASVEEWKKLGVEQIMLSMRDFSAELAVADSIPVIKKIREHLQLGQAIYIHCKAGRSRSAMLCAVVEALFMNNPDTGVKYTLDEALIALQKARLHVIVEQDKKDKAVEIIKLVQNDPDEGPLLAPQKDFFDEKVFPDIQLTTTAIKNQIMALPAVKDLIEYQKKLNVSARVRTPERSGHIDGILQLIQKPNSEQWFFYLMGRKGPFKKLLDATPTNAVPEDQEIRKNLVYKLEQEVRDCLHNVGLDPEDLLGNRRVGPELLF